MGAATLYDVPAPAKINLFLHVVGRRDDGYHLLQTAFRFIDLCDTLHFERRGDGKLVCESPLAGLKTQDDLVLRAAQALQRATGARYGARIHYQKKIPAGGGLGGGSSDAASTLIALNRLWQTGLTRGDLMRLALPLGADVPVFVFGQAAFAEGVGELLSPLSLPDRSYVVVAPTQTVSTRAVFSSPELTRDAPYVRMLLFTDWQKAQAQAALFGRNDLEPVVYAKYPRIHGLSTWFKRQGVNARMTGSGACFFAEFVTLHEASQCRQAIIAKIPYCENGKVALIDNVWACTGLHDHPLRYWLHS